MTAFRVAVACLFVAAPAPVVAQGLDGTWRGTTTGGNCRPFTFAATICGAAVNSAISGQRAILFVESPDRSLRNPSTRRRAELRGSALQLEQIGCRACKPPRAGTLRRS